MSRTAAVALALLLSSPAIAAAQHEHHQQPAPAPAAPAPPSPTSGDHAGHGPAAPVPPSVPPLTDADRTAAFPDVGGHAVHDEAIHSYVLFDRLEWQSGRGGGLHWDAKAWIGGNRDRLWLRSEGGSEGGRLESGSLDVLFGRAVSPWWEVVAGIRQDVRPGPAQTWAAVGIQGLAPYWIHLEATAYLGAGGRTRFRLEAEHELLITNRLVLQPLVDLQFAGRDDPERAIAAGLSSMDVGFRLRYEVRREIAPYVGVTWHRAFSGTAEYARQAGHPVSRARLVTGLRFWM